MAFYFKCRRTKDAGRSRASTQQFQIASSNFLKGGDIFGKFMYLSHCCCRDKKQKNIKKEIKYLRVEWNFLPQHCFCSFAVASAYDLLQGKCMCPLAVGKADCFGVLPVSGHLAATKRKFVYFVKMVDRRLGFQPGLVWSAVDIYQANQIQPAIPSLIPSFFANPWILGNPHGQSSAQNQDKSHALTQGKLSVVFFCTTINYAWALEFLHTFSFGQSHGLSACGHAHKVTAQGQGKTEPEIDVSTTQPSFFFFWARTK